MTFEEDIQAAHSRAQAGYMAMRERQEKLITSLDSESLATVGMILSAVASSDLANGFWQGFVTGELTRRGVCTGCGVDHVGEAISEIREEMGESGHTYSSASIDNDYRVVGTKSEAEPEYKEINYVQDELDLEGAAKANIQQNMEDYGVRPAGPNDSSTAEVVCKECGWGWVSLEDRMLRPPGVSGCPKCQHKAKFG